MSNRHGAIQYTNEIRYLLLAVYVYNTQNAPDFTTDDALFPYEIRDGALINYKDPSPGGTNVSVGGTIETAYKVKSLIQPIFFIRDSLKMSLECLLTFSRICLGLSLKVSLSKTK